MSCHSVNSQSEQSISCEFLHSALGVSDQCYGLQSFSLAVYSPMRLVAWFIMHVVVIVSCMCVGSLSKQLMHLLINYQIESVDSDEQLRSLFSDSDINDNQSLLLETGFRKPLSLLVCEDKASIRTIILDYHTLVKVKPELDQFADGLQTVGILDEMKKHPVLMASMFLNVEEKVLNKGEFKFAV